MTKPNDPISPDPMRGADQSIHNQTPEKEPTGLTKLEYFSGLAMQGILAHGTRQTSRELAVTSVAFAKSLIEELNKENQ